jgi:hypothetical protein
MGLIFSATAGFVLWIVLWSIGVKSFDAFMITTLMIVLAATVRLFAGRRREEEPGTWTPR